MQIADIGSWKVLYLMWIIPLFSIMTADRGRRGSAQQVWPELLRTVMENCLRCYHSINLCTFNCFGADCRTHEGMDLLIRVIIVSSHACPGREMQFGVEMWLQTWNWMTDHRKICASDDDGGDIDHSLTLRPRQLENNFWDNKRVCMLCNESEVRHWEWDWIPGRSVESWPGVKQRASGLVSAGKTN